MSVQQTALRQYVGGPRVMEARKRRVSASRKIRNREMGPFTLRLAAMLDAGLPLVQCLDALSEQSEVPSFQKVIWDVKTRIEGGDTFAEALSPYEKLFGELYVNMIRAGEAGGGLAEVCSQLGAYLEASARMRRRIISAMTYPVIVLLLSGLLTTGMILFIVPKFAEMYEDFDAKLPLATRMLVRFSEIVQQHFFVFALVGVVFGFLCRQFYKTPQGRYMWDRYILTTPVAGKLITKITLARMARTFASLIRSGVSILKAFEIVSHTINNRHVGSALKATGKDVEAGAGIAYALRNRGVFPPMVMHMVAAGEKTGNVDGMLDKVADFYEDEVANMLESLSSLIEPLLMVLLGIIIGTIVICMFLPIFKLSEIVTM